MKKFLFKCIGNSQGRQKGMTLVELMVVLAIFMIVAGLTIFDYGRFRSSVSLQNLADDIALSVRRAQSYAIGVEGLLDSFSNGYGIHFSTDPQPKSPLSGSNKSFVLFSDIGSGKSDQNKLYDYDPSATSALCSASTLGAGSECLDLLTITSNDEIMAICPNSDPNKCMSGSTDITFLRPNPNAYICAFDEKTGGFVDSGNAVNQNSLQTDDAGINDTSGGTGGVGPTLGSGVTYPCGPSLTSIDIIVRNMLSGETKTITVSNVGQISIK